MKYAEFIEQYKIKDTKFPWLSSFESTCVVLYGITEGLTLKEYLIAWNVVLTNVGERLSK